MKDKIFSVYLIILTALIVFMFLLVGSIRTELLNKIKNNSDEIQILARTQRNDASFMYVDSAIKFFEDDLKELMRVLGYKWVATKRHIEKSGVME